MQIETDAKYIIEGQVIHEMNQYIIKALSQKISMADGQVLQGLITKVSPLELPTAKEPKTK